MPKKFTLKPIETELVQIRAALKKALGTATQAKKKTLKAEIHRITKLIPQVKAACKKYDIET